jgi:uncharacterized protein (TIRG00374 family)
MSQKSRRKKWLMFALRWTIAIVGIWYVIANISWRDRALVLDENNHPVEARLWEPAEEGAASVMILDPRSGAITPVPRAQLVNAPNPKQKDVTVTLPEGTRRLPLLAVDLTDDLRHADKLLVQDPHSGKGMWISPVDVQGGYQVIVPYPLIQPGLRHMLHTANPLFLWGAVFIFPVTYLITGLRWHVLLKAIGINLGAARASIINMVGAFYSTFMPGSTGGDVLKAYYAARHAPTMRTRAVMSVLVDRAIGLAALVLLGGGMAAYQWNEPACRQVATASALVIVALTIGLAVFYHPTLRRVSGLSFLLRRLPMQRQVVKAVETMEIYRRRPVLVLATLLVTFPVHITVILSATLAGLAFNLPLDLFDYWYIVPVVVLSGALPISPQGAGVMEFFAIVLTRRQGCTVAQAFALAMSIRLVQIFWNLIGGIFVLRGGYHAPTDKEQEALTTESEAGPDASALPQPE